MKHFFNKQKGSVSIYLILLIVPIFLFNALFIDYARIKLAEKETESALKAAIRSTLSAYDQELKEIGIFGLSKDSNEATTLFREVFRNNLSGEISNPSFNYVSTNMVKDSARFTPTYTLANHQIIKKQILETMKYQAPIELFLEIKNKFNQRTLSTFSQGAIFSELAQKLEKLINKRNEHLTDAWNKTKKMYNEMQLNNNIYQNVIDTLTSLVTKYGLNQVLDIQDRILTTNKEIQSIDNQIKDIENQLKLLNPLNKKDKELRIHISEQMNNLINQKSALLRFIKDASEYSMLIEKLKIDVNVHKNEYTVFQQEIAMHIAEAKKINTKIRNEIKQGIDSTQKDQQSLLDELNSVPILSDDYFYDYESSLGTILSTFSYFSNTLNSQYLFTRQHNTKVLQSLIECWQITQTFYEKQKKVQDEREQLTQKNESEKNTAIKEIQKILDITKKITGPCLSNQFRDSYASSFNLIQNSNLSNGASYFQKYLAYNQRIATIGSGVYYDLNKSEETTFSAMKLIGMFTNSLDSIRNKAFLNEFAMSRFTYRTLGVESKETTQNSNYTVKLDLTNHPLQNQEVEYLIYGFSGCTPNISAAYGEMFSFRLGIRTLEALIDSKTPKGSPLTALIVASALGAVQAYQDMDSLIQGNELEISKKFTPPSLKLNYKDYLRIFLLLHSDDTYLLSRMQALIELNTQKDLTQVTAYAQGQASTKFRLWFMPTIINGLEKIGLSECMIIKNECVITRAIYLSY